MKFGLSDDTILKILSQLNHTPSIENIIIYGSRAKGNYRNGSDIDITLIAPTLTLSDLLKIQNELDDLLLPYKIDLSLFHFINSEDLIDHIHRVGKKFEL